MEPEIKTEELENRTHPESPTVEEVPAKAPELIVHDPAEDNLCDSCQ